MKERYKVMTAVYLLLTKIEENEEYILLQKRQNTSFADEMYDFACSGHLEMNESLKDALIRESKEEIGIDIDKGNLNLINIVHANFEGNLNYINAIFKVEKYTGVPQVMEKDKCSELKWFNINKLPANIINSRKLMIEDYKNNNNYREIGF